MHVDIHHAATPIIVELLDTKAFFFAFLPFVHHDHLFTLASKPSPNPSPPFQFIVLLES